MVDLAQAWVRFRRLPKDILAELPPHVRLAFLAAERHGFEIELICSGAKVPLSLRSPRRLVLVSDEGGAGDPVGPVGFDLTALGQDIAQTRRVFIIANGHDATVFEAAYAAAVTDLAGGHSVAVVIETEVGFEQPWVRAVTALRSTTATAAAPAAA